MSVEITELVYELSALTNAELDQRLEEATIENARSEALICCYLAELRERHAYRDFGYASLVDYAYERFGFKERKTRYLARLGERLKHLPKIREALAHGDIGWTKASRIARVATSDDEATWLECSVALSVHELDRRTRNAIEEVSNEVYLRFGPEQKTVWDNAIEICRRVVGNDISSEQAAEYLAAEFLSTWAARHPEILEDMDARQTPAASSPDVVSGESAPADEAAQDSEQSFPSWEESRTFTLERDGWKCSYPGCQSRCELDVHHIVSRCRGGRDHPSNLTVLCRYHHGLRHVGVIMVRGKAPFELEWTPPQLMREVLERRRNRPGLWTSELEVLDWRRRKRSRANVA